jgi:hypothetical protein
MAIHEFDELTERRVAKLEAKHGKIGVTADGAVGAFPLAGDAEQTAVAVEIRGFRNGKEATWGEWFTVTHNGDDIVSVGFPAGWRAACRQVGLDDELIATEGYLETLARLAFARRGGR